MTRSSHYICDCLFTNAHGTDYIAEKLAIHFDYFLVSILSFAMVNFLAYFYQNKRNLTILKSSLVVHSYFKDEF